MKKSTKFIIALLVTVGALAITYRVVNQAPSKSLPLTLRCKRSLLPVAACNAIRVVRIFLYANWPVAGGMVQKDVEQGYRAFDITEMAEALKAGKPVGKVALAKVEKVIMDGTMPKHAYYMVHWGASVTDAKRKWLWRGRNNTVWHIMLTGWLQPNLLTNRCVPSLIPFR